MNKRNHISFKEIAVIVAIGILAVGLDSGLGIRSLSTKQVSPTSVAAASVASSAIAIK